jgi:hypothetical protein
MHGQIMAARGNGAARLWGSSKMSTASNRPGRTMFYSVVLAAFMAGGAALVATPVLAATWDAIAVDDDTSTAGGDAGYGVGQGGSKAEAESQAMKACKGEGNSGCAVEVSYNSGCGAYASSKKYSGHGTGGSKAVASAAAMKSCGDSSCKIVVADCVGQD